MSDKNKTTLVCLGLVLGIAAVFGPLLGYDFSYFDDKMYVTENPQVIAGLTWEGFLWAFRTGYAANWHPLTWLSHMLDCQWYGLNAGGHHLTNILLHTGNALLLFFLLKRMTGALWPSAVVTGLFAFHPLRLESVAWIAERKDVLSMFFCLLALRAYAAHAEKAKDGVWWRSSSYWQAAAFFTLGLLAKPMLVTLPFLMLLLDVWPLGRWPGLAGPTGAGSPSGRRKIGLLVQEKVPLFILAIIFSLITYFVQKKGGAVVNFPQLTWQMRLTHMLSAYQQYIVKLLWPGERSINYLWRAPQAWQALPGMLILAGVSLVAVARLGSSPWLAVGWFWFLGALFPVSGIVHIGAHFIAERYTYLPSIGFFLMLVYGISSLKLSWLGSQRPVVLGLAGLTAVYLYAWQTGRQQNHWRNAETLFKQTLKLDPSNYIMHDSLASYYQQKGRGQEARAELDKSLAIEPKYSGTWNQLGNMLAESGQINEAAECFRKALGFQPKEPEFLVNLATMLKKQGRLSEAAQYLDQALAIEPNDAQAHSTRGTILEAEHRRDEAIAEYRTAIQIEPSDAAAHNNLAVALMASRKIAESVPHFRAASDLQPQNFQFHYNLACALAGIGDGPAAAREYRRSLEINPNWVPALQRLAWWLATNSRDSWRDGRQALSLAERACALTASKDYQCVAALDAALAELGRFAEAIATAEKAGEMATLAKDTVSAKLAGERAQDYRAGHPYRAP